jgi:hypothetical protein
MTSQSESHKWTESGMKQLQTLCIADLDHNTANAHLMHYTERKSKRKLKKYYDRESSITCQNELIKRGIEMSVGLDSSK